MAKGYQQPSKELAMRRILFLILGVVVALVPAAAFADDSADHGGFAMRVNGDYRVAEGDSLNALVVIRGNARVDGTVHDTFLLINGDATVNGTVDGDIRIVDGTLTLATGASVNNIQLVRSDLVRQPG